MTRLEVVARARGLVGVRFRAQGRDPGLGIDCVGLAALACGVAAPDRYPERGGRIDDVVAAIEAAGLRAIDPVKAGAGDLLLAAAGARQWHLIVLTGAGFVHADAGLRRVTEVPGEPPWPIRGAWAGAED